MSFWLTSSHLGGDLLTLCDNSCLHDIPTAFPVIGRHSHHSKSNILQALRRPPALETMHPDASFLIQSILVRDSMQQDSRLFSYFATFWQDTVHMTSPTIPDFAQIAGLFSYPPAVQQRMRTPPVRVKPHSCYPV